MATDERNRPASIFVSDRERRLWIATVFVVLGIYSTLGNAPIVSDLRRSRGLLEPAFGLGVTAIAAAVMLLALPSPRRTR